MEKNNIDLLLNDLEDIDKDNPKTSRFLNLYVKPKVLSKMAGHSCVETAQRYYIQPTAKGYERAIKIAELSDDEFDNYLHNQNNMIGHNSK